MNRLVRTPLRKPATRDALLVAASLLAIIGCSATNETDRGTGGTQGGGEPLPSIEIRANTLADGMTNAGPGPFPVTFYGEGRMLDGGTVADLMARLALTTWPEGMAVPVTTTVKPSTTDGTTGTKWRLTVYGP